MDDKTHISETVSAGQLRAFIERIERVEEEIKTLNGDKSDIYKELRACGFDVKAVRQCVAARKMDSCEREERDAIFHLYWNALNGSSRVHVHETDENPILNISDPHSSGGDDGHPDTSSSAMPAQKFEGSFHPFDGQIGEEPNIDIGKEEQESGSAVQDRNEPVSASGSSVTHSFASAADRAASTVNPPIVEAASKFDPGKLTFLHKTAQDFRPHCLDRDNCAGYGLKHCYACLKARDEAIVEEAVA